MKTSVIFHWINHTAQKTVTLNDIAEILKLWHFFKWTLRLSKTQINCPPPGTDICGFCFHSKHVSRALNLLSRHHLFVSFLFLPSDHVVVVSLILLLETHNKHYSRCSMKNDRGKSKSKLIKTHNTWSNHNWTSTYIRFVSAAWTDTNKQ